MPKKAQAKAKAPVDLSIWSKLEVKAVLEALSIFGAERLPDICSYSSDKLRQRTDEQVAAAVDVLKACLAELKSKVGGTGLIAIRSSCMTRRVAI